MRVSDLLSIYIFRSVATVAVALILATDLPAAEHPAPIVIPASEAKTQAEMKPYAELVEHTDEKVQMLPIPGGSFLMGSPADEKGRSPDEGPQHEVTVDPFWMSKFEITWDIYEVWMADLDIARKQALGFADTERDRIALPFQISRPTKPYTDMTFGMGKRGYPAISMTQHAARVFCEWFSAKTGRYYRLPTEAEWEYACRAGTTTAYSFGDDPSQLDDYGWYYDNSNEKYEKIGQRKPNPWGLHDMHGNVAEWVLDVHTEQYDPAEAKNPLAVPLTEYNRVVRGGSWDADPTRCRSAARLASTDEWKQQDPQEPQSIWYLTDAKHVGIRIVRPLVEPTAEERAVKWDKQEPPQIDEKNEDASE